jgi:hypothetical protein
MPLPWALHQGVIEIGADGTFDVPATPKPPVVAPVIPPPAPPAKAQAAPSVPTPPAPAPPLTPQYEVYEAEENGRTVVDVDVTLPGLSAEEAAGVRVRVGRREVVVRAETMGLECRARLARDVDPSTAKARARQDAITVTIRALDVPASE